ncbi:hypothetical protein B9G98_02271 [Wickerhamiella sorbophila]|uniref:Uncharacterized protein n=1 Tax=Wickerhamiella sorbophila TaxID=45607 RepID=A0A2T0FI24_9ASCO|nr:hypothetical protein B9G98_02271 [Wickerhamiella sorbophila]PRT54651.1 hypothetical protein B9G98_02271 [Wickerhamiella sorbophila]
MLDLHERDRLEFSQEGRALALPPLFKIIHRAQAEISVLVWEADKPRVIAAYAAQLWSILWCPVEMPASVFANMPPGPTSRLLSNGSEGILLLRQAQGADDVPEHQI